MRVYLIGYMASGKSNFGRLLAEKLGYTFLDLDYLFEKRYRISVLDCFEKYNEAVFRKIECELLSETVDMDDVVVSTGGGTPCYFNNMDVIRKSGISIYLHWEIPVLVNRLKVVRRKRPLLKNIPLAGLEAKVTEQLNQREFFYRQADIVIDGENLDPEILHQMVRKYITGD